MTEFAEHPNFVDASVAGGIGNRTPTGWITRRALLRATLLAAGGFTLGAGGSVPWEALAATLVAGAIWIRRSPSRSPIRRSYAAMAYDESTKRIVLFGGIGASNDTWTWDGSDWILEAPTTRPPERWGASMFFGANGLALFGGQNRSGVLDDTWIWQGSDWTGLSTFTHPSRRVGASVAADGMGTALLFGGFDGKQALNDTWIWDGRSWDHQSVDRTPQARYGASLAYDPALRKFLLFGGQTSPMGVSMPTDVWAWDWNGWSTLSLTTSLPSRAFAATLGDAKAPALVAFGGLSDGRWRNDTWSFQKDWRRSNPAVMPESRAYAALSQDGQGGALLFGGQGPTGLLADTWTLQL